MTKSTLFVIFVVKENIMRSLETLRNVGNRKLAAGLAVAAGALGAGACGEELPEERFKANLHISPVEILDAYDRYGNKKDDYDDVPKRIREVHAYCAGKQLTKSLVLRFPSDRIEVADSTDYPFHPACKDNQLTPKDAFTANKYDTDEHQKMGEYSDGKYCVPGCSDEPKGRRYAELECYGYEAALYSLSIDLDISERSLNPACEDRQITREDHAVISEAMDQF
jgi:hypothetical protein